MSATTENYLAKPPFDETIARWVTNVISPHNVAVLLSCVMTLRYSPNISEGISWLAFILLFMTGPPLAYAYWLVRIGYLQDIHMPNREKRLRPLIVTMSWLLISLSLMLYLEAPAIVELVTITAILMISILASVTLFWKISFHSATISAAVTTLIVITGYIALPTILLIPLVGWSRVRLKRHTIWQVIMGCLAGTVVTLLMVSIIISQNLLPTV